jgi:hypothetical protein
MLPLMHEEMVHPLVQLGNLDFRLPIDLKVMLDPEAVFGLLAVLAHHDHWGLNSGQAGKNQVEQGKRIGIERLSCKNKAIDAHPDDDNGHHLKILLAHLTLDCSHMIFFDFFRLKNKLPVKHSLFTSGQPLGLGSFSHNPFPDVCRAILNIDAVFFATSQKFQRLPINELDIFQIENHIFLFFGCQKSLQLRELFGVDLTAQVKDGVIPLDRPLDFQCHRISPSITNLLGYIAMRMPIVTY